MSNSEMNGNGVFSPAILEAVRDSVEKTYAAYCGQKPTLQVDSEESHHGPCIAGIISFFGETPWSLSWVLGQDTAPALAKKFAGFDIPFESADMGDMAGELVNVLAGEVVAQLEQRRIKSQMSLPTVARGCPLDLMPERGMSIARLHFHAPEGNFWLRLTSAKSGSVVGRIPGK